MHACMMVSLLIVCLMLTELLSCFNWLLAEQYRSHENKWYFLTSRDRKYPKGNRPDRAVLGKLGTWKTTQKHRPVYDATSGQMVGHKGSLAYFENEIKTMWLMHEYTINGPNLPFENGEEVCRN